MTQAPTPAPPETGGQRPHRGAMILVFGILSFVCCFIFGIVAFVMGGNDLAAMQAGEMDREGEGLTKAGRIIGLIGAIVYGIGFVLWFVLVGVGMISAILSGGGGAGP